MGVLSKLILVSVGLLALGAEAAGDQRGHKRRGGKFNKIAKQAKFGVSGSLKHGGLTREEIKLKREEWSSLTTEEKAAKKEEIKATAKAKKAEWAALTDEEKAAKRAELMATKKDDREARKDAFLTTCPAFAVCEEEADREAKKSCKLSVAALLEPDSECATLLQELKDQRKNGARPGQGKRGGLTREEWSSLTDEEKEAKKKEFKASAEAKKAEWAALTDEEKAAKKAEFKEEKLALKDSGSVRAEMEAKKKAFLDTCPAFAACEDAADIKAKRGCWQAEASNLEPDSVCVTLLQELKDQRKGGHQEMREQRKDGPRSMARKRAKKAWGARKNNND